jgi:hypothetical protein
MELVVTFALLWIALRVISRLTEELGGDMVRPLTRFARTCARQVTAFVWTGPMRRHGFFKTVWLWLLALACLLTLCCLVTVPLAPAGSIGFGGLVLSLWALVITGWWFMRWRARRRYTPRPMHTRRRRR